MFCQSSGAPHTQDNQILLVDLFQVASFGAFQNALSGCLELVSADSTGLSFKSLLIH